MNFQYLEVEFLISNFKHKDLILSVRMNSMEKSSSYEGNKIS